MPKIHPETKVLIIEDQIHCWGGRHLQCVSASSTEDKKKIWRDWRRFWQVQVRQTPQDNRSGGPFVGSENPRPAPFPLQQSSTRPGHLKSPCQPEQFVEFCLEMASMVESVPRNQHWTKRQLKNHVAFAKAHSLPKGWMLEKWQWKSGFLRLIFCWITSQSPQILQETYWSPHGSGIHPENSQSLVVEKSWSGVTFSSSRRRRSRMLQDWPAQSPDMNIIEHVWGRMKEEAWKKKPNNLDELWEACKTAFFAIPDDFINKLYESLRNRMDAVLQAHGSHTRY